MADALSRRHLAIDWPILTKLRCKLQSNLSRNVAKSRVANALDSRFSTQACVNVEFSLKLYQQLESHSSYVDNIYTQPVISPDHIA